MTWDGLPVARETALCLLRRGLAVAVGVDLSAEEGSDDLVLAGGLEQPHGQTLGAP
jgi:hypothetical protein